MAPIVQRILANIDGRITGMNEVLDMGVVYGSDEGPIRTRLQAMTDVRAMIVAIASEDDRSVDL